jgi:hypothetical protein
MLTVNAAVSEGVTLIATVHDGFGCLPSRAALSGNHSGAVRKDVPRARCLTGSARLGAGRLREYLKGLPESRLSVAG